MSMSTDSSTNQAQGDNNPRRLFDSNASLAYFYALGIIGPILFLVLPVLLGALYVEFGFSETQLGSFATSELMGMAIAAASGILWIKRVNWRNIVRYTLALVAIGNLATYFTIADIDFNLLLGLRFVIGLAGGAMAAVFLGFLSQQRNIDKAAGGFVVVQVAMQVCALYLLPILMASALLGGIFIGAKGAFALFTIIAALLIPLAILVPTGPLDDDDSVHDMSEQTSSSKTLPPLLVLGSFIMFYITQTSIWGFLELMGSNSGLTQAESTTAITLSTLFSTAGAMFAVIYGDRYGRFKPLAIAAALQVIALVLLGSIGVDFMLYLLLLSVFQIGWTMGLAYHYSTLIGADPSHRFIVLLPTAQAIGLALGPIMGGIAIESFGYPALLGMAGTSFVIYCALILPVAKKESDEM